MAIAVGDAHGCLLTLMALIEKLPKGEDLYFLGDYGDRGPNPIGVVEYVKNSGHTALMGNHEEMLLLATGINVSKTNQDWARKTWQHPKSGGLITMKAWERYAALMGQDSSDKLWIEHTDWMAKLPIYAEYMNPEGEHFILSHTNVNFVWDIRNSDPVRFRRSALWSRDFDPKHMPQGTKCQIGNSINVIGHTPVREIMDCGNLLFIDTGCGKGGKLSAYNLDTHETYTQECIDKIEKVE